MFLVIAGLSIRVINLLMISAIEIDGIGYANAGALFSAGEFVSALRGMRVPFYPALIGLVHLFIPDAELAGRLVSLTFGVLLIPFCYFFVKRFFGTRTALYAAAAIAFSPYLARYSAAVLSESTATFFFSAAVFSFYRGWTDKQPPYMALSGILLTCTYMTRSEYIIYFGPFLLLLFLHKDRRHNVPAFLAFSALIVVAFLVYIRIDTGFWVIDRRMLLIQSKQISGPSTLAHISMNVPFGRALMNLPEVIVNFCDAVFIPFILLALIGAKKAGTRYCLLLTSLVAIHFVGRSFMPYSTPRYSVEFVPLIVVPAAIGADLIQSTLQNSRLRIPVMVLGTLILILGLFMGMEDHNPGRSLERKAGKYLHERNVRAVASRLPIIPYYARSTWVHLGGSGGKQPGCPELKERLLRMQADYVALDDRMQVDLPAIKRCLNLSEPETAFSDSGDFIYLYRLNAGGPL